MVAEFEGFRIIRDLPVGDQRLSPSDALHELLAYEELHDKFEDHTIVEWVDIEGDGSAWWSMKTFGDQEEALSFAWAKAREDKEVYVNRELCTLERMEDDPHQAPMPEM